jgi:hypothetical protein
MIEGSTKRAFLAAILTEEAQNSTRQEQEYHTTTTKRNKKKDGEKRGESMLTQNCPCLLSMWDFQKQALPVSLASFSSRTFGLNIGTVVKLSTIHN